MNAPGLSYLPTIGVGVAPQLPPGPAPHVPKRIAPTALVVRLDDHRPRTEAPRADIDQAVPRAPASFGFGYDHVTFAALDRPGPSLAFAAQLHAQEDDTGPPTPPAVAAAAYRASAAARTGFMGLLDPLELRA